MRGRKGFTLIELILVIAILGILAISALPRFLNVSTEAAEASRDGVVGAVRAGIALWRANDMVTTGTGTGSYPAALDGVADGADCGAAAACFATVLANGVEESSWHKTDGTHYTHTIGSATTTWVYDATNGTFNQA